MVQPLVPNVRMHARAVVQGVGVIGESATEPTLASI